MDRIVIVGGEGTALNIAEAICDAISSFGYRAQFLGFANDDRELRGHIGGYPVVCSLAKLSEFIEEEDAMVIFQLFRPDKMRERRQLLDSLSIPASRFATFVHPKSYVSPSVRMGFGNILLPNSTVMSHVTLGNNNIIGGNVVIEHDASCGSCNFLASGVVIGSRVTIGDCAFLGLNSTVREHTTIADGVFVGMGSNVLKNAQIDEVWYGNPARQIPQSGVRS